MTRAAFEMLVAADLPRGQRFGDLFRAARYIVGPGAGLAWRRRIVTEAWRLVRLNDYCRMDLVDGALLAASEVGLASGRDPWQVIGDTRSDLDGEVIHGVAMLALLEIETPDIEYKLRVPPRMLVASGRHRCGRASSVPEDRSARLAIVTVNFSDTALERAYSCNSKPSEGARPGRPRARHMVRGHLFRARNGKMVYRRPHWRGSAIGPVLHRVRR